MPFGTDESYVEAPSWSINHFAGQVNRFPHHLYPQSTTQTIASSHEMAAQTVHDITQLLDIVNTPLEPEQTLDALMTFTSNKNNVEAVRKLDREDAAKLIDVFDQVCRGRL